MGGMNLLLQGQLSRNRKCRIHRATDYLFTPAGPEQHDQLCAVFTAGKEMITSMESGMSELLLQRIEPGVQLLIAETDAGIP